MENELKETMKVNLIYSKHILKNGLPESEQIHLC